MPLETLPEIFRLIESVDKKLKNIQRATISETGLTPPQYFVLTLLWEKDQQPFKDLAEASGYTRATMTGIVDTMEKKNLVTRQPHPSDRRSRLVTLTQEGAVLQDSTPTLERIFRHCCVGLAQEEIRQLGQLLQKLDESLTI